MTQAFQIKRGYDVGGIQKMAVEQSSGGLVPLVSETIPGESTDLEVAIAFAYAKLTGIYLYSERAMTIKTNSSSVPDDTIALAAGVPLDWSPDSPLANPFTADVTSVFVTLAAGDDSDLVGFYAVDPT